MDDHDRLIKIDTCLGLLMTQFKNHLKHHMAVSLVLLTALLGLVIKLLVS